MEIPEALDSVRSAKMAEVIPNQELTNTVKPYIASDLTKEMQRIILAAQRVDLENGRIAFRYITEQSIDHRDETFCRVAVRLLTLT